MSTANFAGLVIGDSLHARRSLGGGWLDIGYSVVNLFPIPHFYPAMTEGHFAGPQQLLG